MRGRFIVLEGIDGSGKSTQLRNLAAWLPESGLMLPGARLHFTREPGGTALGASLRELLLHPPGNESPEDVTELLLYAADRAQHVSQVIKPALQRGDWVISDRFSGSTMAYQGYGRKLNIATIRQLELIATQGLKPDLTIWLDINIKESLSRRGEIPNDRIENEGQEFLERVAYGFNLLAKERSWTQIKSDKNENIVSHQIKEEIIKFISKSNSQRL